jgi:hypothetical protein
MTTEELNGKNADIESLAGEALKDSGLLTDLLDGLKVKAETYRYNCYKVLYLISQTHGEVLYPEWDRFAESLGSPNSYHKMSAVHLIANLTAIDAENRFEEIFEKYYSLLDDRSMVVAYYTAAVSGRIVRFKPHLEKDITKKLLSIDNTHHEPGRKELVKTGIIEALGEYYAESADKERISKFVEQQLDSESPKTRKTALAFMDRIARDTV